MCLGIPMKITRIDGRNAVAETGGITKSVRLDLLEGVETGDYVLIHTGYAIEKLDRREALKTIELIEQVYRAGLTGKTEPDGG